ncbi:MAG TPA: hypothetical protein VEZ90_09730, partial [Blastocatellia bacterium]|nr:hypothetical protein [Blastocatellia bacterium]
MRLISALILVSALLPSWFPRSTHRPGIDPAVAAKVFVEAKQCSDRDGGRLWGLPIYGPMMFVDVQTHEIATNRSAPGSDLKEVDGAYVGHLPESVGIANAAVEWAGVRWSMIMWPLPEREYPRERLLMHESFHRIQPQLKLQSGNPANAHL